LSEPNISLRTIAERVNVSVASVSYVLNGKGRMSAEKREAIGRMLREAGYRPRFKRHPVFYLLDEREFKDMHAFEPFLRKYEGLNAVLQGQQMIMRPFFLRLDSQKGPGEQIKDLLAMNVGGVILDSNLGDVMEAICQNLARQQIPAVQLGHTVRCAAVDAVVVDSFGGACDATRYLIRQGHRKIATIRWNVKVDPASNRKFAGYSCALTEAGLPVRPEYVVESPFTKVGALGLLPGRVAVEALLALPEPPTAVFVENSFISPGLIYPQDPTEREVPAAIRALSIIHFEAWNLEWIEQALAGKLRYPPRRTHLLRINWQELGQVAARLLLSRMESGRAGAEVIGLAPRLYEVEGFESRFVDMGTGMAPASPANGGT
jgi:LacI family transcriptional regulator